MRLSERDIKRHRWPKTAKITQGVLKKAFILNVDAQINLNKV